MSLQASKRNSFRQSNFNRTKLGFKNYQAQTQKCIPSFKKLPLIRERKYSSTKNLIVSTTYEIASALDDFKQGGHTKILKKVTRKDSDRNLQHNGQPNELKYFFKKRIQAVQPLELGELKKYSSCNKLKSFPSIPQILVQNDESFVNNEPKEQQRQIKSSNSIKLETIQYIKKPRLQRIPLKKILKSQMSKTINPRKIQSENSIQLQNEQKTIGVKKKSKLSKDGFERIDSRTKILVKNPFNKITKKYSQIGEKIEALEKERNLETLEKQFRLSKIFQDANNQSDISMSGKSDIQNLIGFINR